MARNKYPQETVDKILDTAQRLFLTQGYEHTSIQDIIDHLGGLTKGAIYHHFKSKEDIFLALAERQGAQVEREMSALRDQAGKTGLERLREMFLYSASGSAQSQINEAAPCLLDSPKVLVESMRSQFTDVIPHYICAVVEEGVADGSIRTDHPRELAQLAMVVVNYWLSPMIYPTAPEEVEGRVRYCAQVFRTLGLDLFDEELIAQVTPALEKIARRH